MHDMTGSRHYLSGLYTPGTVMLQPAGYIRGLGAGLRRAGVGVYEQSPVTRITREGADWSLTTPRARISAGKVILATNGHLESFGFAPGRLMHVFLYASMTAEMDRDTRAALGGASRWGITPSDPMGTTLRRLDTGQGGNRIVTRTCATFAPGMEVGARALRRAAAVHRAKFAQRFPQLRGLRQEHSWAGHLCLTRNGVSVMRELEPGLYAGCVQNGLGTARGTLTGIGAAELACGTTSAITRHFTAQPDPTPLPPQPLATLGANGWLRWKEWCAQKD
jgi:glycine/D-amino acid oxidase-like deaminating enzyme